MCARLLLVVVSYSAVSELGKHRQWRYSGLLLLAPAAAALAAALRPFDARITESRSSKG